MNKNFERRLRKLEQQQKIGRRKKRILPEWLLEQWHEDTGLPLDTDEQFLDNLQRMQQPAYRPKSE